MNINKEFHVKIIDSLIVALFFSLTFFLFGPSHVFLTNTTEFNFLFSECCYYFVLISLLVSLPIAALLLFFRVSIYKKIISLLFVLSILLWIQGNVLVWDYGLLDGNKINWNAYFIKGLIDSGIWILFIIIALIRTSFIYKIIRKVSIAFILIQVISLMFTAVQAPEPSSFTKYDIDTRDEFIFSSKKNVIILLLDAFQSDVFQEIIDEDNDVRGTFKGFTYFRNALGGFQGTYAAVPLILTGQYYDNSIPIQEFIKNAYLLNSIPKVLKENDFQVDLFPSSEYRAFYFSEETASNLMKRKGSKHKQSVRDRILYIYDVTLLRYTPLFIKKYIDINSNRFFQTFSYKARIQSPLDRYLINSNVRFINGMETRSTAYSNKYTFKFFHLLALHPPYVLNEQLKYEDLPLSRHGYKRQAKGYLVITKKFLDTLNRIGIYDNSMIFVMGDHGGEAEVGVKIPENLNTKSSKGWRGTGRPFPLILVKPFNSRGEMIISDAPVSLSDIPKTIFSELGLKGDFTGSSMFEVKESDVRERRYLAYNRAPSYIDKGYFSVLEEYIISGFSWFDESWHKTGRLFKSPSKKRIRALEIFFGHK